VYGVGEAPITGVAGRHDLPGAAGAGDRRGAGVVLAGLGVDEAVWVVAELAEDPGAEHDTEAGQAHRRCKTGSLVTTSAAE
jgi:hypothetical protein